MDTTTIATTSVALIAVGIFLGGWWIGDAYGYTRRQRDELCDAEEPQRQAMFTPKATVQSWSREQLESAFAQREYQLILTRAQSAKNRPNVDDSGSDNMKDILHD